jgi:hypothetical protein
MIGGYPDMKLLKISGVDSIVLAEKAPPSRMSLDYVRRIQIFI